MMDCIARIFLQTVEFIMFACSCPRGKGMIINDFIIKKVPLSDDLQFCYYRGRESVVIVPDGVTDIQSFVFGDMDSPNDTITKIVLPNSCRRIDEYAFANCTSLKELVWPDNDGVFLGYNLFAGCSSLEKICIPKSVEGIVNFMIPENLKTVEIHDDLMYAGQSCFNYENDSRKDRQYCNLHTIKFLLENPNYKIIDNFMVNTKHKTVLFNVDYSKSEVRVPDGIETISLNAFDQYGFFECGYDDNAYMGNKIVPLEKVILPKSIRNIHSGAFFHCRALKSVVYEGSSENLKVSDGAFEDCGEMSVKESKIICEDSIKKNKKTTHLMMERIIVVHKLIKSGCFPNSERIRQYVNSEFNFYDPKEQFSLSTISRDLDFLRTRFSAPLEFDRQRHGYYYTEDFELKF